MVYSSTVLRIMSELSEDVSVEESGIVIMGILTIYHMSIIYRHKKLRLVK